MKNPQFNANELRRSLMEIEHRCDTVLNNLAQMRGAGADYATAAVTALQKLAHDGLRLTPSTPEGEQQ